MEDAHHVLRRGERREMNPGNGRNEVCLVAETIAGDVGDNYVDSHGDRRSPSYGCRVKSR